MSHKSQSQGGFTLLELLISIIFITVLLAFGGALLRGCSGGFDLSAQATENLNRFSSKAGLRPIECNGWDTDGDGYISCTAKNSKDEIIQLQCGYGWNSGCKLAPRVYQPQ